MYYAGRLERRYDMRFPLSDRDGKPDACHWAWRRYGPGAGARYSWRGVCGCASKISNNVLGKRNHEIYWYTGPDGQRVLMKWYSLGPNNMGTYRRSRVAGKGHQLSGLQPRGF